MIYRVLFAALVGASLVVAASEPSSDLTISEGESVDAPPQQITVDEEQPVAAFQDDQPPVHVATGSNGSAAGGNNMPDGVTGQPSVTEYKFASDKNTTDSAMGATALTALAAVSLTILL
ncbi:hypothetical protein PRIPAC_89985 [Pristionchus pacificus]|uniref:Uncharacterized protein n=1 Tax=Pristionchus pacificus TaxID=54126 RepID=A0A2A6B652_PRIPA|nr:hypothetical protein PRIPAC_89985 [Pristionchus pacificus]|eukprot:PDM61333.1 hypothetical protein PRIPAC_50775 [Pristionchus pacificus]